MAGGNTYDDDWRWGAKKDDIDGGSTYDRRSRGRREEWRRRLALGSDGSACVYFFTALMRVLITALIRSQLKPQ